MSEPIPPFWFKQRQGKAEPAGTDTCKLTAPNLGEAFIGIRPTADGHWSGFLRLTADGSEADATGPKYNNAQDAWGAAFELYRVRVVT
jgi:hypothetical protein